MDETQDKLIKENSSFKEKQHLDGSVLTRMIKKR